MPESGVRLVDEGGEREREKPGKGVGRGGGGASAREGG